MRKTPLEPPNPVSSFLSSHDRYIDLASTGPVATPRPQNKPIMPFDSGRRRASAGRARIRLLPWSERPLGQRINAKTRIRLGSLFTSVMLGTLAISGLTAPSHTAIYHVDDLIGSTVDFQPQTPYDSHSHDLVVQAGDGVAYDVFGPDIPSFRAQASSLADGYGLHAHTSAEYIAIPPAFGFFNS